MEAALNPSPGGRVPFRDPREIAHSLGISYLGSLAAELRAPELTGSLAGLAPDPRFSERLFRFVTGDLPLVWVAGLGDAGEEIPVAVGLAARAATKGVAPVLLVRPGETLRPGTSEHSGRPIEAGAHFGTLLGGLSSAAWTASATGIQGVYRAWCDARPEGDALWPAAMVVAGGVFDGPPVPEQVTHLILVIPYRDQPRERIEAAIDGLGAARERIIGFVAYGSLHDAPAAGGEGASPWPSDAAVATPARGGAGGAEPSADRGAGDAGAASPTDAGESGQPPDGASPPACEPLSPREEAAGPIEEISAAQAWTDSFGPRRPAGLTLRPAVAVAGAAIVIVGAAAALLLLRPEILRTPRSATPAAAVERPPAAPARPADAPEPSLEEIAVAPEVAEDLLPGFPTPDAAPGDWAAPGVTVAEEPAERPARIETSQPERTTEPGAQEPVSAVTRETPPIAGRETPPIAARDEPPIAARDAAAEPVEPPAPEVGADAPPAAAATGPTAPPAAAASGPTAPPAEAGVVSPPAEVAVPAGREAAAATDGSRERTIHDMVLDRGGPFAVLCGSFRSERRAETEAARLAQGGHPARLVTVRIPEQGVWHRVLVGECAGEEAARALAREVAAARIVPACQVVTAAGVGIAIGGPISGGGS